MRLVPAAWGHGDMSPCRRDQTYSFSFLFMHKVHSVHSNDYANIINCVSFEFNGC